VEDFKIQMTISCLSKYYEVMFDFSLIFESEAMPRSI